MTAPSLLDELEPCPFCGTPDVEVYPTDRARSWWSVCCGNPGCVTRGDNEYLTEADAIVAWNHRTHHATIAAMAKRLEAAERDARATKRSAETLCRIYFEIAAEAAGEDKVRAERDRRIHATQEGEDEPLPNS